MSTTNIAVVAGNLTRDAQIKYTASGMAVVSFGIAVNDRKKVGESWQDDVSYFDVTILGKYAEAMHKHLLKGRFFIVTGKLKQDRWEQDGQARSKVNILADSLQPVGGGQPGSSSGTMSNPDDDIPF